MTSPPPASMWITESIELIAPIAEGAMGSVWEAYHHGLQTKVAVKFVSDKLGEDTPEALARFQREAATASQIKSAHVVRTFDSGLSRHGAPYMVMELLEGQSLGSRLRQNLLLGPRELVTVLAHVGRALDKAHEVGIVHRDIKPDNIFLCPSEEGPFMCKVLDFGIAKQTQLPQMGGLTTEGKLVGTPEYMSPEQVIEGAAVGRNADLWALAVVAYVSLTGRLPFEGDTIGKLCLELAHPNPTPVSQIRSDLSKGSDLWFARSLNRQAAQRFGSAREMTDAFVELVDVDAPFRIDTVTQLSLVRSAKKRKRQSRKPVVAAVVVTAVLAGTGAWVAIGGEGPTTAADPSPSATETADRPVGAEKLADEDAADESSDDAPAPSAEPASHGSAPPPARSEPPKPVQRVSGKKKMKRPDAAKAPVKSKPAASAAAPVEGSAEPKAPGRRTKEDLGF